MKWSLVIDLLYSYFYETQQVNKKNLNIVSFMLRDDLNVFYYHIHGNRHYFFFLAIFTFVLSYILYNY